MPAPETMRAPVRIDAGQVVLRKWALEWAPRSAAAIQASLPELMPFMPWATAEYNVEAAREFIRMTEANWKEGTAFSYAVFDTAGELVGSAGLTTRMGAGTLEIGYWIHSHHTGRGYATLAATALAHIALSMPGVERVVIRHDVANPASGRVAAKAGFVEVDRVEHQFTAPGNSGLFAVWELRAGAQPR